LFVGPLFGKAVVRLIWRGTTSSLSWWSSLILRSSFATGMHCCSVLW